MAGYFTDKRTLAKHQASTRTVYKRPAFPVSVFDGNASGGAQVTTSFRTRPLPGSVDAPKSFGSRDPFEVFYAYSSAVRPRYDTGHTFQTDIVKHRFSHPVYFADGGSGSNYIWFRGPLIPNYGGLAGDSIPIPAWSSNYYGALAIARTVPTNPAANLSQTLAELIRDGVSLPGLALLRGLQGQLSLLRGAGSEYLNIEFGWKPLVSDLNKILVAVSNTRKLLEQLERDSGRLVRRRFTFDDISTTVYAQHGQKSIVLPFPGTFNSEKYRLFEWVGPQITDVASGGLMERVDKTTQKISFSGAYTYYFENGIDPFAKLVEYEAQANHLLGIRFLTPEVLWNLAPWSWLADWFANFGTLATNVTRFASDDLVLKYGYLMRHTVTERTYIQNGVRFAHSNPGPFFFQSTLERKERVRATPFGFGLNPSSFTARQWAILAALGFTRAPQSLY
jgi:hypothetical protein